MHLDNLSRNGKTQPCAALGTRVRTVDLAEFLENPLALVCRNSRSRIVDANGKVAICYAGRDAHLTSVCELDGVADEIEQHLGQALLVAESDEQGLRHL